MLNIEPVLEPRTLALAALHHLFNSIQENNLWSEDPMFRLNNKGNKSFIFYPTSERKIEQAIEVKVIKALNNNFKAVVFLKDSKVKFDECKLEQLIGPKMQIQLKEGRFQSSLVLKKDCLHFFNNGVHTKLYLPITKKPSGDSDMAQSLLSPMPCKISHVQVKKGDKVKKGQTLVIVEAMKMEHVIKSPKDGIIKTVSYKLGDIVEQGKVLVEFE